MNIFRKSSERVGASSSGLADVPPSKVHRSDDDPELLQALIPYNEGDWHAAKVQLAPLAIGGNLLAIFKYANTLEHLGDLEGAEHFWRIAVAAGDANSSNNLANLLKNQGRLAEVRSLYQSAADTGSTAAMRNLALFIEDEDPEGAEKWFLTAATWGDAAACANLAINYFAAGKLDEARKFAELGIERGSIYAAISIANFHMLREEWHETVEAAKRALTLATESNRDDQVHAYKILAIALIQLHSFDEATDVVSQCRDRDVDGVDELETWLNDMKVAFQEDVPPVPKFCTNCGSKLFVGAKFCTNCGQNIIGSNVVQGDEEPSSIVQLLDECWRQFPSLSSENDGSTDHHEVELRSVLWFASRLDDLDWNARDVYEISKDPANFSHPRQFYTLSYGLLASRLLQPEFMRRILEPSLARGLDWFEAWSVCQNPNTPEDLIDLVADMAIDDSDIELLESVVSHPNLRAEKRELCKTAIDE